MIAPQYYGIRLLPVSLWIPTLKDNILEINLHVKYLLYEPSR